MAWGRAVKMFGRHATRLAANGVVVRDLWRNGISDELVFWRDYFAGEGRQWHDDYLFRTDPDSSLQEQIKNLLSDAQSSVRILDVGAGPLTIVGKRWSGHDVSITAVDALADEYAKLLDEFRLAPLVRTRKCDSEHLDEIFSPRTFDLAYARNTLDHSYEPMRGIKQMVRVVRPGGVVLLEHRRNEAVSGGYAGLHQWNFDLADGRCLLWRPGCRFDLGAELAGSVTVDVTVERSRNADWVRVVMRVPPSF